MTYIIGSIIFMSFVTYAYWRMSSRKLNTGLYLLFLYTGSIIAASFLDISLKQFSFLATFYFFSILFMFLLPVMFLKTNKITEFRRPRMDLFNLCSYIFIILGFVSIVFYVPICAKVLLSSESLVGLRGDIAGGESPFTVNFFFYITALSVQFFPIVLLFFFYSITFLKKSKKFNIALLIASTSHIWSTLAIVGRTGFVLWTMSFCFCYFLFYHHMEHRIKKIINRSFLIFSVPFSIIFMMITISRFSFVTEGKSSGPLSSILYYFGMQFSNFNTLFNVVNNYKFHSYFDIFPILRYISSSDNLELKEGMGVNELANAYKSLYGVDVVYNFSTFIGHAWLCLDTYILLVLSLIFSLVFSCIFYKIGRRKKIPFNILILYTFIAQIPLHGVFYYTLGHVVSNIYMINVLIMVLLFRRRFRRNSMFERVITKSSV